MVEILLDLSPENLIAAMEGNLAAWIPEFGKLPGAVVDDQPGVKRSLTSIPFSLFNSVMETRLEAGAVDPLIELVQAEAGARRVPVLWWVGPSSRPLDLAERLIQHGFTIDEDSPGMAVSLAELNQSLPAPDGLTILPARDEAAWKEWSRVCGLGFGASPSGIDAHISYWTALLSLLDPEKGMAFTAWLNGNPVSTSLLLMAAGVAGIYAVATLPEARHKGIGARVTLAPLLYARERGYKAGVLEASEMGYSVYHALGFRDYCRIGSYRWKPGQA